MRTRTLAINDVEVNTHPVVYTCYGLGSCIGLFVADRLQSLSAGAHIALPASCANGEFSDAVEIMNMLLTGLHERGSDLTCLRAKVVGGANVCEVPYHVGEENRHTVLQYLLRKKIFVAATDLGGHIARTARFNSITGELEICTSDHRKYFI